MNSMRLRNDNRHLSTLLFAVSFAVAFAGCICAVNPGTWYVKVLTQDGVPVCDATVVAIFDGQEREAEPVGEGSDCGYLVDVFESQFTVRATKDGLVAEQNAGRPEGTDACEANPSVELTLHSP